MRLFLTYLPVLGCAGAMVLCMRMMDGRGGSDKRVEAHRVAELEEENARVRSRIELSPTGDLARKELLP